MQRGAVIFDRDGVLNQDFGYCFRQDQIVWIEGALRAVKAVNDAGLYAFVATNQSGIARGYYSESDVVALHDWMAAEMAAAGARIDAFVYSPYHPEGEIEAYRRATDCRKPGPGMIHQLHARFGFDRACTVMVGDKDTDIQAAAAAGIEGLKFSGGSLHAFLEPVIARLSERLSVTRGPS